MNSVHWNDYYHHKDYNYDDDDDDLEEEMNNGDIFLKCIVSVVALIRIKAWIKLNHHLGFI